MNISILETFRLDLKYYNFFTTFEAANSDIIL